MLACIKISQTKELKISSNIVIDKLTCVKINMGLKYNLVRKHLEAVCAF
ncbi:MULTISPECIES: hypothetical protein [Clostridium]|uniref:Uncharacterized protein n=1 Tax=Clostridium frigoriphilum TaxID=443253 RepID=A0ABU7UPM4_9CLOT|nr:hypothetical protein [Clostridium sp. DSM 17811]MBU3100497.1 hypothetical protein [Clostridium sp. DSM 17811]